MASFPDIAKESRRTIPPNPIFDYFNQLFNAVFGDIFSDDDLLEECFVGLTAPHDEALVNKLGQSFYAKYDISYYEEEVIKYVVLGGNFASLCFVGPVGCGKTTILRKVVDKVFPVEQQLKDNFELIYIDLNAHKSRLLGRNGGQDRQSMEAYIQKLVYGQIYLRASGWLSMQDAIC